MNRKQKTILFLLTVVACGLSVGTMVYAYHIFAKQPLAPPLPEFTPLPLPPTWTPTAGTPVGAVTLAPTFAIPPTSTVGPICHGPPVMYILAIGADSRQDAYIYGLADAIRVARVEFAATPKITILEIPRDLWVYVPHIADNLKGLDHAKLNQAYLFGQPGDGFHYWDDPSAGPGLLALTLNENFGARSDKYISVNMRTFENIVNAVGGIDLEIRDEETALKTGLPVGVHHLDGPGALKVARNREEGMFARAGNQNLVLCALQDKLVSPEIVTQIPELIASFKDNVLTDLSPDEITQLACLGMKIQPKDIVFASFPEELFKPSRHTPDPFTHNPEGLFIWDADFEVLRNYVAQFQAGSWPPPPVIGKESTQKNTCE